MTPIAMYANDPRLDPRYQEPQQAPPPQPKESGFNPLMAAALGIGAIATGAAALRGRRGVTVTNLPRQAPAPRPVPAPRVEVPVQAPRNIPIDFVEPAPRPAPQPQQRGMNTSPTRDLSQTPAPRVQSSGGVTAERFTPAEVEQMFSAPRTEVSNAPVTYRDNTANPGRPRPTADAQMSMNYRYGKGAAPGIQSANTLDAIAAGERTATTRWGKNEIQNMRKLQEGSVVEFRDKDGRSLLAEVTKPAYELNPRELSQQHGDRWLGRWSKLEGWSPEWGQREFDKRGVGMQMQYRPLESSPIDLGFTPDQKLKYAQYQAALPQAPVSPMELGSPSIKTDWGEHGAEVRGIAGSKYQSELMPAITDPQRKRVVNMTGGVTGDPVAFSLYNVKGSPVSQVRMPQMAAAEYDPRNFQNLRQTLGDVDRTIALGLTKGQSAENIGEVYMRGTSNDAVYRPSATPQRWVDQPLHQVDAYANGGPAWVKGDDGILALGERDRPVSQIMHDLDTEHGFKGAVDWRKMSSNMPSSDTLDAAPQWATRTQPMPQGREVDLFAEGNAVSPYANERVGVERKAGSFNIVTDATEKGDGNWLKPADISVPGVGTFPLTRGATVDVDGVAYGRNPSEYFDMDASDAIAYKRGQAKDAAAKFLTNMNSPTVSPVESLANQKAYELHRQGLTTAERDYANAYRQMEMPDTVTYKGRVSLPAGQSEPVKQYLASKGLEVDAVTLPRDPDQTHVTFRGSSDVPTQMEVQRVLSKDADREVLQLPPGYSIAPENVHGFAKHHPGAQPGQLYKGVEWSTDEKGKQFISKAGEPVLNERGKPQGWAGQPIEIVEGIDRPTVKAVPVAYRDVPTDIDPEWMGLRDQWKVEKAQEDDLKARAQALVQRKMAKLNTQAPPSQPTVMRQASYQSMNPEIARRAVGGAELSPEQQDAIDRALGGGMFNYGAKRKNPASLSRNDLFGQTWE